MQALHSPCVPLLLDCLLESTEAPQFPMFALTKGLALSDYSEEQRRMGSSDWLQSLCFGTSFLDFSADGEAHWETVGVAMDIGDTTSAVGVRNQVHNL